VRFPARETGLAIVAALAALGVPRWISVDLDRAELEKLAAQWRASPLQIIACSEGSLWVCA
jgi:hypothetical protein